MKKLMMLALVLGLGAGSIAKAGDSAVWTLDVFKTALDNPLAEAKGIAWARLHLMLAWLLNQAIALDAQMRPHQNPNNMTLTLAQTAADDIDKALGNYYTKGKAAVEAIKNALYNKNNQEKMAIIKETYRQVHEQLGTLKDDSRSMLLSERLPN